MGRIVELLRRHPGVAIVVAAVALAALGARYRSAGDGTSTASELSGAATEAVGEAPSGPDSETETRGRNNSDEDIAHGATTVGAEDEGSAGSGGAGGSEDTADGTPTTTDIPPDVAHPRPAVDLHQPPDGSDVVEVARWWAAVYTAYEGAEPGDRLAERLEGLTTATLSADLVSLLPPASYDLPLAVDGASAGGPFVREDQDPETERTVRVSVETSGALVVYDVALVDAEEGWLVAGLEAL